MQMQNLGHTCSVIERSRLIRSVARVSRYAFYVWPGNSSDWSIFINGGGWCLTEELCNARAQTALGSSLGYNITGAWGPPPRNLNGGPPAYTCQGLDPNCTRVFMPYCDGSCLTSSRDEPWRVNGTNSTLHFRGLANLDRTLDVLESRFGLGNARRLVLQGGSAGGLSTYLHLDHVSDRLSAMKHTVRQPTPVDTPMPATVNLRSNPQLDPRLPPLQVVGRPVAGFFIDEENFNPEIPSYAADIKYGVAMFNSTLSLSAACRAAHSGEEWRCWMAPYAAPFVRQPIFAVQSRFDEFQLMCLLALPCFAHQSYEPPFASMNCSLAEHTAIVRFGAELVTQLQPLLAASKNGVWLVSCIQHDVVCDLHGVTEEDAFASWLSGGPLGKNTGYRWVDDCERNGTTPCNTGNHCSPPHF